MRCCTRTVRTVLKMGLHADKVCRYGRSILLALYLPKVLVVDLFTVTFFVPFIHETSNVFPRFFLLHITIQSGPPQNHPLSLAAKVTFLMRHSEKRMAAALSIRIWAKSKSFICWWCVNARNDEVIFRSLMKSSGERLKSSHMIP